MFERLSRWQDLAKTGMSKDKYIEIQEQLGYQIDLAECPPDIDDFPDIVIYALNIFNSLGDRIYPEIGYVGKDYTNLDLLLKLYDIDNIDLLLSILLRLDAHAIKTSQDKLKREYDKLKSKNSGRK